MTGEDLPQLTVIGRTSSWSVRVLVEQDRSWRQIQPRGVGERSPLTTWLHSRGCGTIGVYLASDADMQGVALLRGQWLEIVGVVRPCLAYARADDPRSVVAIDYTPLFLEAAQVRYAHGSRGRTARFRLRQPQQARLLRAYGVGPGSVAPLAQWPDSVYWHAGGAPPSVSAAWNTVRGVVTTLDTYRYLRYVLSFRPPQLPTKGEGHV